MIVVVAPEPAPWIDAMVELASIAGPVRVLAPWTLPIRAALRIWSGGKTRRRLAARLALRAAVDEVAARALPRETRVVVAPSLAARRTFARAARLDAVCALVEDLPWLRELHDDLDGAARVHSGCPFLRNYRAPAWAVVRQEAERVLARSIFVRGRWARERLARAGVARPILDLPRPRPPPPPRRSPRAAGSLRVLLAGLATARNGTIEALEAIRAVPGAVLFVHVGDGEGLHPPDLLRRAGVAPASHRQRTALAGIDVVLAPSWCESYPHEVLVAEAAGVPVIATRRAAGPVDLSATGVEVPPGDPAAIQRALARIRSTPDG